MGRLVEVGAPSAATKAESPKVGRLVEVAPAAEPRKGRLVEAVIPKAEPPKEEASLGGTALDVGRGLVEGVVALPGDVVKIGLAAARPVEAVVQQFVPGFAFTQNTGDYIDQINKSVHEQLSGGARGYSTRLGPIEISGNTLGQLISGVAIPGAWLGKTVQATSFAGRMWGATKMGMKFGAATSVPDVILSRTAEQAQDRMLNAGISIGVGGLLAGAMHGGSEAAAKLFKLGKVPTGPAQSRTAPEAREGIGGITDPAIDVAAGKQERFLQKKQDIEAIKKGNELAGLLKDIEKNRVVIKDKQRLMREFEKRGLFNQVEDRPDWMEKGQERKFLDDLHKTFTREAQQANARLSDARKGQPEGIKAGAEDTSKTVRKGIRTEYIELLNAQKERELKYNTLNAEVEAIAEVIAARGYPVGDVWTPSGSKSFIDEAYGPELAGELTRRIKLKKEALNGANQTGVREAFNPMEAMSDVISEATGRVREGGKKAAQPPDPRIAQVAETVLADQKLSIKTATEGSKNFLHGVVEKMRGMFNPIGEMTPEGRAKVVDILGQSDMIEHEFLPKLRKELMTAYPNLSDRQLFALLNDPRGSAFLKDMKISSALKQLIDTYRVAYDEMFNIGVRSATLSPDSFWRDFVNRMYDKKTATKMMEFLTERQVFSSKNEHSFERTFQTLWEAEQAGFKVKTLDIANLFENYMKSMNRTLTNNYLVQQLQAVAPEAFKYVKDGVVPYGFKRAPDGLLGNTTGEGTQRYIRNNEWRVIDNLVGRSKPPGAIDKWNSWNKRIKLSIDVYHLWQIMRGYTAMTWEQPFGKWKKGYEMLQEGSAHAPMVEEAVRSTLSLTMGDPAKVSFDKTMQALEKMPWSAKLLRNTVGLVPRGIEAFSDKLWNQISPGLKILMYTKNLEKLMSNPKFDHLSRAELTKVAAQMTNKVAGGSPWQEHGRSVEFERNARLILLAPNWIETRFRLFGGGLQAAAEATPFKASTPEGALYGKYWTGYVAQGLLTAMAANAVIQAAFPEVKKHKAANGLGFFTHITFPTEDRNGRPLVMSPYPGIDYIMEAVSDWNKFYKNRMSPAAYGLYHLVSGQDYKGAKDRPAAWSLDTFINVVEDAVPVPMLAGSAVRTQLSETFNYEATKSLFRSLVLGLHNHPQYPVALRDEEDFLKNEAARIKQGLQVKNKYIQPLITAWFQNQARRHDEKVRDWIKRAQKMEGAEKVLATVPKFQRQLFVGGQ